MEDEDDLGPENEESGNEHGTSLGRWAFLHRTAPWETIQPHSRSYPGVRLNGCRSQVSHTRPTSLIPIIIVITESATTYSLQCLGTLPVPTSFHRTSSSLPLTLPTNKDNMATDTTR